MSSTDTLIPVMTVSVVMPNYVRPLFMLVSLLFAQTSLLALQSLSDATDSAVNDRLCDVDTNDKKLRRPDLPSKVFKIYHQRGAELDFDIEDVKVEAFGTLQVAYRYI
jgi:hypothetical protein